MKTWTHHVSTIILIQEEYATNLRSVGASLDFFEGLESSGRNDIEVSHVLASGSYSFCQQVSTFSKPGVHQCCFQSDFIVLKNYEMDGREIEGKVKS